MEQTLEEAKASLRAQAQLPLRKSSTGQASGGGGSQHRVVRIPLNFLGWGLCVLCPFPHKMVYPDGSKLLRCLSSCCVPSNVDSIQRSAHATPGASANLTDPDDLAATPIRPES
jgi:hypothetical protein